MLDEEIPPAEVDYNLQFVLAESYNFEPVSLEDD